MKDELRQRIQDILNELAAEDNPQPEEPWTLPRQLPEFRALRDGEEWHRQDFRKEMLEGGWRPCIKGEIPEPGDEYRNIECGTMWHKQTDTMTATVDKWERLYHRTKRPLPILTPQQISEGWKEWHGGENPAPGKRVMAILRDGWIGIDHTEANILFWNQTGGEGDIIAYRVIEPHLVPLGPEDVRCGDEIIVKDNVDGIRYGVAWVRNEGVQVYCVGHKTFKSLMDGYLIRRRNSDTFEPCSKEAAE